MIAADGQALITALRGISALDSQYVDWASVAAQAEDLATWCPGAWVQPAGGARSSEAGGGRHIHITRTWLVVVTVSSDGIAALETEAAPLIEQVRQTLTGLRVGNTPPLRRVHYSGELEPFYAPGYLEAPLEFEITETFSGDTQ